MTAAILVAIGAALTMLALGVVIGFALGHHGIIRKYRRDPQWVLDWLEEWK